MSRTGSSRPGPSWPELRPPDDFLTVAGAARNTDPYAKAKAGRSRRLRRTAWIAAATIVAGLLVSPFLSFAVGGTSQVDNSVLAAPSLSVRGPTVVDRLDRPGLWQPVRGPAGRCSYAKALVISAANVFRCPGPSDTFAGDQTIAVNVAVDRAGSCAVIWFRSVKQASYRLAACPDRLDLQLETDKSTLTLATMPTTEFTPGRRHRVVLDIRDNVAEATVDGDALVSVEVGEPALIAGQVTFGVVNDKAAKVAQASFTNAEIRSR